MMSMQESQLGGGDDLALEVELAEPSVQPAPSNRRKRRLRDCTRLISFCIPCHKKKRVSLDSEDTQQGGRRYDVQPVQLDKVDYLIGDSKRTAAILKTYTQAKYVSCCDDDRFGQLPPIVPGVSSFGQGGSSTQIVPVADSSVEETSQKKQYVETGVEHQNDGTVQKLCLNDGRNGDTGHRADKETTGSVNENGQTSDGTVSSQKGSVKKALISKREFSLFSSYPPYRVPSSQMRGEHRGTQSVKEILWPPADVLETSEAENTLMDGSEISRASTLNQVGSQALPNAEDGSLVRDVKLAVSAVSTALSNRGGLASASSHARDFYRFLRETVPPRQRHKYIGDFFMLKGGLSSVNRNNSFPSHGLVYMQTDSSDYCHPRFAEEKVRLDTFKYSTSRQRKGFESAELARVGWYFNRRAVITFCCGMEMPQNPRGEPLDVHRGLSPQCSFALNVKTAAEQAFEKELEEAASSVSSLAVGGAAAVLRTPTQCTEDPLGQYTFASDAFEDGRQDMFVGHQETRPGSQWENTLDFAINFSQPVQDSSYRESLVTSITPTAAEVWQPFSSISEEPNEQAPSAPGVDAGRMSARAPSTGEYNSALRLLRSLNEVDGRQSPIPIDEQVDMMGGPLFDGDRPRHRQFAFPSVRIWTYEGWPQDHSQLPAALVDAGLFYAGYGDCVLCFSCGIGLRHWTPMDNPWIEHARWRPSCYYVRSIQGPEFVEVAVEMTRNNRHPTYEEVKLEANRRRRAADEGVGPDGLIDTSNVPPPENDAELNLLCKACYRAEMCMVLMPCRHLALCERCTGRVFACPICRTRIERTFRARFD